MLTKNLKITLGLLIVGLMATACGPKFTAIKGDNSFAGRVKLTRDIRFATLFETIQQKDDHRKLSNQIQGFEMTVNQNQGIINLSVMEGCQARANATIRFNQEDMVDTLRYSGSLISGISENDASYAFNIACIPTETQFGTMCSHYLVSISKAYGAGRVGSVLTLIEQSLTSEVTRASEARRLPEEVKSFSPVSQNLQLSCDPAAQAQLPNTGASVEQTTGTPTEEQGSFGITGVPFIDGVVDPILQDAIDNPRETYEEWYERIFGHKPGEEDEAASTTPVQVPANDPEIITDIIDTPVFDRTTPIIPVADDYVDPWFLN